MSGTSPGGLLDGLVRFVRWYEGVAEGAAQWCRENEPVIRCIVDAGPEWVPLPPLGPVILKS